MLAVGIDGHSRARAIRGGRALQVLREPPDRQEQQGQRALQGAAGARGPPQATAGRRVSAVAGIALDQGAYTLGSERTFTVTGWGFHPGESVLIIFHTDAYGPGHYRRGRTRAQFGAFEADAGGPVQDGPRPPPAQGTYTVRAEGSMGSLATAPITFVEPEPEPAQ